MLKIFVPPVREILKETVLNKGMIGKVDFDLIKSKVPFNWDLLKANHLTGPARKQFSGEESIKLIKKTIGSLEDHFCLIVDNSDNFTYVAVFTKSPIKGLDPTMAHYKFITKIVAGGKENILGYTTDKPECFQKLIVDPFLQFDSAWVKLCHTDKNKVYDNVTAADYWAKHKEEIADIVSSHFNDPSTLCLRADEVISNAHEVILKIMS